MRGRRGGERLGMRGVPGPTLGQGNRRGCSRVVVEDEDQAAVGLGIIRPKLQGAAVRLDRLVELAALAQHVGEVGVRVLVGRLETDRALEAGDGRVALVELLQGDPEVVAGVDVIRIEGERRPVARGGRPELAQHPLGIAEVVLGGQVLRADRQRGLVAGDSQVVAAISLAGHAEIEVGFGVGRQQGDGLLEAGDRLVQGALGLERDAQVVERFGILRAQRNRLSTGLDGQVEAAERLERRADVQVVPRAIVGAHNGPADQPDGEIVLSELVCEQTKQVQRFGVCRLVRECPAVVCLGLGEAAGPVELYSLGDGLIGS